MAIIVTSKNKEYPDLNLSIPVIIAALNFTNAHPKNPKMAAKKNTSGTML